MFASLLSAPILFFLLGALAVAVRSDLAVPGPVAKGLSLYLLAAIGLHGGVELAAAGLDTSVVLLLVVAATTSLLIPLWSWALLRLRLPGPDAAAAAACYGSVSAVTFVTAIAYLERAEIDYSGAMVAVLALMESPAIVAGVVLARLGAGAAGTRLNWKAMAHEALTGGPVVLLVGGLLIGLAIGTEGWAKLAPFAYEPFTGVLCLFLLDMGMVAARRLAALRERGLLPSLFALVAPAVHGLFGIGLAALLGLGHGDALLFAVLVGSASYIAVPAAMRLSVPQADPGTYVPMSLGLTFPYNVLVGIPLLDALIRTWW